ncbi:MAG: ABC transporter ATP-binding protein [bacterium]|nr:ABC transporter ATP-binding protein [bacterium]
MIEIADLEFAYGGAGFSLRVDDLAIEAGEEVACIGPSGTGKTTLIHLIAGIEVPARGRIVLDGVALNDISDADRRALRISEIGMVFQRFELLDYLDGLDNILLPYRVSRRLVLDGRVRERARELARATGIEHVLGRPPRRLSQGERQRVALCRALVTEPKLVICDEPTGNLDPDTAALALDLVFEQARARGATLLMVTHDHGILDRFSRVIDMRELNAGVEAPGVGGAG